MDVSVIVVNYNTFDLTSACIRSVIQKTQGIDLEIILVDNASTDRDPDFFYDEFPAIKLIKNGENLGFAKANNIGIEQAAGKYILLLNSDTECINNAVAEAMRLMEQNPAVGVLSGQLQYPDGRVQAVAGRFPSIARELFDLFRLSKLLTPKGRSRHYLGTEADYSRPLECDWVWGTFFMFRREDLGVFPDGKLHEDFFMYQEDMQWCYFFRKRLKKRIVYSTAPKVLHHMGASGDSVGQEDKYFHTILPNEYQWLLNERGWLYTRIYYLVKAIHYYSLRNRADALKARHFIGLFRHGIR
jgi:GT2 family glycosyltransferase